MAIQYVGGRGAGRAGSTSTVAVAINSGLTGGIAAAAAAGDLVVVTVAVATQGRNPSCAVSGYTAKTQQHTTATTYDISVCTSYKIIAADTSVTIPSTGNIADGQGYTIHVFRGVDPANIESVAVTYNSGSGTNNRPDGAAVTPGHAGAWIYVGGGGAAATGTTVFTAAALSGFLSYNGADTNDGTAGAGYYSGWSSGAYDPAVFGGGSVNAANSWGATTLALRPLVYAGVAGFSQEPQGVSASGSVEEPGIEITGVAAFSQPPQELSATGAESFTGTGAVSSAPQTLSAIGSAELTFEATVSVSQMPQTLEATGQQVVNITGEAEFSQAGQTMEVIGGQSFTAEGNWSQTVQSFLADAAESYEAEAGMQQAAQLLAADGEETFEGQAAFEQSAQTIDGQEVYTLSFTGTMSLEQAMQIIEAIAEVEQPTVAVAPVWKGPRRRFPKRIERKLYVRGRRRE